MTDSVIRSRIDPAVKLEAVHLFGKMGLSISEAIRLFVYQSVADKRIPFSINFPNQVTLSALKDAELGIDLEKTNLTQLRKDWKKMCAK